MRVKYKETFKLKVNVGNHYRVWAFSFAMLMTSREKHKVLNFTRKVVYNLIVSLKMVAFCQTQLFLY